MATNENNLDAYNEVEVALGGLGMFLNDMAAVRAIAVLEGASGGPASVSDDNMTLRLNAIDVDAGGAGGHLNTLDALNSIVVLKGGVGGHENDLDAINEWVDFASSYLQKLLDLGAIAVWPFTELSGSVADNAEGTAALDGTYSGVTLDAIDGPVVGERAPQWDAVNDRVNLSAAAVDAAWDPAEFTVFAWYQVRAASVWTDSTARRIFDFVDDADNRLIVTKSPSDNRLQFIYEAGAITKNLNIAGFGALGWNSVALSISAVADEFKMFDNGVQIGGTQTGLGTWNGGGLNSPGIGATATPGLVWDGYLAYAAIFPVLTPAQILDVATL